NPWTVGMPGGVIELQVEPIEKPSVSVMRLENSPEMSTCLEGGTSPVLKAVMVGSESSSATQGSSVASVAGRKRAPTKECAKAGDAATTARAASAAARTNDIVIFPRQTTERDAALAASRGSGSQARIGGPRGRCGPSRMPDGGRPSAVAGGGLERRSV